MSLLLIALAALLASGLTLFSGFGLGTLLMPVFALFMPLPLAIAATALVHFANNLFKFWLMASLADWGIVLRFGLPATLAAFVGALLLTRFDALPVLATYTMAGAEWEITPLKLLIGLLIIAFSLLELWPRFQQLAFPVHWLPLGGVLSGFFGGLSGNQGAFRSAFLIKAGLSKEAFVATGVVVAVIVDAVRLLVYGGGFLLAHFSQSREMLAPVLVATLSAFVGALIGRRLLRKVTLHVVRMVVASGMLLIGAGLASGLV